MKLLHYTITQAHVLIANPNPLHLDRPYTLQYGSCGQPGAYIHLTPAFVTESSFERVFGPKGVTVSVFACCWTIRVW